MWYSEIKPIFSDLSADIVEFVVFSFRGKEGRRG